MKSNVIVGNKYKKPTRAVNAWILHVKIKYSQIFPQSISQVKKVAKFSEIRKDDTVLEIGTGSGLGTYFLAKKAKKVITLDINKAYLNKVGRYFKELGIDNVVFRKVDISKFKEIMKIVKLYKKEITLQIHNPPYDYLYEALKFSNKFNTRIVMVLPLSVFKKELAIKDSENIQKSYKFIKKNFRLTKLDKFIRPGGKSRSGIAMFMKK